MPLRVIPHLSPKSSAVPKPKVEGGRQESRATNVVSPEKICCDDFISFPALTHEYSLSYYNLSLPSVRPPTSWPFIDRRAPKCTGNMETILSYYNLL